MPVKKKESKTTKIILWVLQVFAVIFFLIAIFTKERRTAIPLIAYRSENILAE